MKAVSPEFAFALRHPDLWTGLLFHDREEDGDLIGITEDEWEALELARPHLEESVLAYLRATHRALRTRAGKSKSDAVERVRRARLRPGGEGRELYGQVYLSPGSSYTASVFFGFDDELEHPVRPYVTLWGQAGLRDAVFRAAAKARPGNGVERVDHAHSVSWHLPPPEAGDSFADLAEDVVHLVWPAAKWLAKRLA